jgi:hypothetical protein
MVSQQAVSNNSSDANASRDEKMVEIANNVINLTTTVTNLSTIVTNINTTGGSGNVTSSSASSADNTIARFDGIGGKTVQVSGITVSDDNKISGTTSIGDTAGITFGPGSNGALTLTSGIYNGTAFNGKFLQLNNAGVISTGDVNATLTSGTAPITVGTTSTNDVNLITNNKKVLVGKTNGTSEVEVTIGDTTDVNIIYFNGSVEYNYKEATGGGDYNITNDDYFVKFTGTVTYIVKLLTAAASGRTLMIRNSTNVNISVNPLGTQTIGNGTSSFIVPSGVTLKLMADGGTDWLII